MEMIGQVYVLDVATGQPALERGSPGIKQLTTEGRNGLAVWEPARQD